MTTAFFRGSTARILGGSFSRFGINSQGRTNSIFTFNRRCNCATITSYCCVDTTERQAMLNSIFKPGLLPFSLARQPGQTWRVAYPA